MEEIKNGLSRRSFIVGTAATGALAALGLSGCGNDAEEVPAEGEGEGAATGELSAAVAYETTNFLPFNNSSALAVGANWHVVEGLYELDMTTYEPFPALAAGDPVQVSDTEYEITLREGAAYSDGTPVTAEDVVVSYKRTVEAEGALYLSMLTFIKDIVAKDETTVTVLLNMPFSLLKNRLALIKVCPAAATDEDLTAKPLGSGPWAYSEITEKNITFVPNEFYTGTKPATAAAMRFDIIKDDTARTQAMTEQTVQVMENVPADMQGQLEGAGVTVEAVQGFGLAFLMFNTKKAPFDDNRVRQACFYAIDMQKLIDNALSGLATPLKCFLPETYAHFHEAATVFTYDPEKAKALLAEAGAEGTSLTLQTTDHPWIKALSPQIKNDLEAIGLTVAINEQASAALYANQTDVDDPQFDVALAPGDPSCFGNDPDLLMNWWYGDNIWTQKRTQWNTSDEFAQLRELMAEAVEASGDEQQELWNQCYDLIADQVPLYPLFHKSLLTGYLADALDGYKPIGTTGISFVGVNAK